MVEDIDAAIEFFTELGLELEGRAPIEGDWADGVTGLRDMRVEIAMMRTPDGHSRLEMSRFLAPPVVADHRSAPVNALGYLRVMFTVEDIDDTLARLGKRGAKLVGEVVQYEDTYRLCYIRGPVRARSTPGSLGGLGRDRLPLPGGESPRLQVIAHRLARMATAGTSPSARDRAEFQRMGIEKIAAANEAWTAMATQTFLENQKFALTFMQSLWFPWMRPTPTVKSVSKTIEQDRGPRRWQGNGSYTSSCSREREAPWSHQARQKRLARSGRRERHDQ